MRQLGPFVVLAVLSATGASAQTHQAESAEATLSASEAATHDVRCVEMAMDAANAIQAAPANDGHDQDRLQAVMRRINYFVGKIIARDRDYDFAAAFKRYDAVDRPGFSQDHQALIKFFDGCVAEQQQSWSAFAGGVTKAAQK